MERLLFSREYMYELFLDKDGNYFFDVVVGWIGWFTKRVQLSEEQVKQYQEKGEEYLNGLSSEVNAQGILEARIRKYEYEKSKYGVHKFYPTDWKSFQKNLIDKKILSRLISILTAGEKRVFRSPFIYSIRQVNCSQPQNRRCNSRAKNVETIGAI